MNTVTRLIKSLKEKVAETYENKEKKQSSSTPLNQSFNDEVNEIVMEPIAGDSELKIGLLKALHNEYQEKIIENQSLISNLQDQQNLANIEHMAEIEKLRVIFCLFNA